MANRSFDKVNSEIKVEIQVPSESWAEAQKKAFNKLATNLKIKGMRQSKLTEAKKKVASKMISSQSIWQEALSQKFLQVYLQEALKEIKDTDQVIDHPTFDVSKISDSELTISFSFPTYPEMKKFEYKKLGVKFGSIKPTQKDIDEEIKTIVKRHSKLVESNEKAEKGDDMTFDFTGFIDGKEFEGGAAEDHSLIIGGGTFIPGFEDQLVGLKKGDKSEVKVTFPKDYYVDEYKAKDAVFKIVVKAVKKREKTELTKEFIEKLGIENVSTVEQLTKYVKEKLDVELIERSKAEFKTAIIKAIDEKSEIVYPRVLVLKEMKKINEKFEETLKQQGITRPEYLEFTKMDEEKLAEQIKAEATKSLTEQMIMIEVSRLEKINAEEKDYESFYIRLASQYGMPLKSVKDALPKAQMQVSIVNEMIINKLIELNDEKAFAEISKIEAKRLEEDKAKLLASEKATAEKEINNSSKADKQPAAKKETKTKK
ncbi:trigger factor [Mycoplasma testudineum]|uniref:Trigger factor n=1 Tax=Mycoplasma testudineum TaxID=244584 RepID=A0A4R6IEF3_9MOLU|nr:trigger factor [Mycoplasma testudineum]OYD26820.1 trigger factor [Mycoplasma testudineum]TDO20354.1 trigger factor [Mycoplasma testudineum]